MTDYTPSRLQPGDRVEVAPGITGTVEELVFARGMSAPFVLVEYWHEGTLVARRFHAEDCEIVERVDGPL